MDAKERAIQALMQVGYERCPALDEEWSEGYRGPTHGDATDSADVYDGAVVLNLSFVDTVKLLTPPAPLTKEEHKALEQAVELMGDCTGAKTLWNLLTRLSPQKGGSTT